MARRGIVSSSTSADAQIQIEPDETVQNEPPSRGISDRFSGGLKVVPVRPKGTHDIASFLATAAPIGRGENQNWRLLLRLYGGYDGPD